MQVLFKDKEKEEKEKKKQKCGADGDGGSDNGAAKQLWHEMTDSEWEK